MTTDQWSITTRSRSVRWGTAGPVAAAIVVGASGPAIRWLVDRPGGGGWLVGVCGVGVALVVLGHRPLTSSSALGLPAVTAAELVWIRTGDLGVTLSLLALALPLTALGRSAPAATERVTGPVLRATVRAGTAVASAVLLVVTVPLMYVPGFLSNRIGGQQGVGWQRPAPLGAGHREAAAPFAPEPVASRRRRVVVGLGLVVVVAVVATVLVVRGPDRNQRLATDDAPATEATSDGANTQQYVPLQDRPAGAGQPGATELLDEWKNLPYRLTPDGPNLYDMGDYRSRYTNVEAGVRRSRRPAPCSCEPHEVWLVGGSAAFGLGQRDDHTIASGLVAEADSRGIALEVRNLAVPGWTLWNEHRAVTARLDAGEPPPAMVVFYDGFNDMLYSLEQSVVDEAHVDGVIVNAIDRDPDPAIAYRDLAPREVARRLDRLGGADEVGRRAGRRFAALQDAVRADLEQRGIKVVFVFQPDALAGTSQRPAAWFEPNYERGHVDPLDGVISAALAELLPGTLDLRHLFDGDERPLFLDIAHSSEAGAAVVAARIFDAIDDHFQPASSPVSDG